MLPGHKILRGARSVLGWSQPELAKRAKVSLPTVTRVEGGKDSRRGTIEAIVRSLQEGGIQFLPPTDSEGEGIRLRPDKDPSSSPDKIS
ncbi:MAG: helix-turn-helix domain-containing protein [Nisaea sp.]|uniref:helix-turn-helix domain-containing protein n=1 Tax=Nisaea sp. TaxID=2024842 RepID=UPI001B2113EF|nr:helix-turn-helix domain-containing protein [Nisaea sp.]